jgi:hypothetical protein
MGRSTIGGGVMWKSVPYTQVGEERVWQVQHVEWRY